jgi:hypothetical protein
MYRPGMVCKVSCHIPYPNSLLRGSRCTKHLGDPNSEGLRRCREHTEALVAELELGVLWDEYGLVGDVVVSDLAVLSACCRCSN